MCKSLILVVVVLLSGCENMMTLENGDCWIFVGEAGFRGRITESNIDGKAYVRKGSCSAEDLSAALEATG